MDADREKKLSDRLKQKERLFAREDRRMQSMEQQSAALARSYAELSSFLKEGGWLSK